MIRRFCLVSSILAVATGFVGVSAMEAQTVSDGDATWVMPRTPDGHPDLQGNWTNATLTPFERPEGQGPVLSREQALAIERGQAETVEERSQASDPDRPPPEAGGTFTVCIDSATGCYNEVYRDPGDRVAVVGGELRSSLVTEPSDGRVPEVTEEARRRVREDRALRDQFGPYDHPELRPLAERCLLSFGSSAGPPMLPNYWYNNNYTIVQTSDHVLIMAEMVHDARIIRIGDGPRLPPHVRPWMGDSWGRWEGDTLVVETTNFHPLQRYRGYPSDDLRVVERFTRVDEETILYEFTIDDPTIYTRTWGGQVPFRRLNDNVYEYACHEGNYSLANVLSGARYQERTSGGDR
jgi:hypothetical protein